MRKYLLNQNKLIYLYVLELLLKSLSQLRSGLNRYKYKIRLSTGITFCIIKPFQYH
jgi:hypothetical protein